MRKKDGRRFVTIYDLRDDATDFDPPSAAHPSDAQPGSAEKIAEFMTRAECGEDLWHPNDKTCHPTMMMHWPEWYDTGVDYQEEQEFQDD